MRQLSDNFRKTLNIIHHSASKSIPTLIASFDADKAFDRLEPLYLLTLLKAMNFGPCFLRTVETLYVHPKAQVYVNSF